MNKHFQIGLQPSVTTCPCCGGERAPPVPLAPLQYRIFNAIRQSRFGLTGRAIVRSVYFDRYDGGPRHAQTVIYMTIARANGRLAAAGIKIANVGHVRGGLYTIQRIDGGASS
jgi:hypothetical protein